MTSNRNPVKQLFITFPHSHVDKSTFRDTLLRFDPSYYKVCEEKHKDGTPHLHAVIKFKSKYSQPFILKYYKEIYPEHFQRIHIKAIRSIKHSIDYLSKEDPEPLESGSFIETRGNTKEKMLKAHILAFKLQGTPLLTPEEEEEFWKDFQNKIKIIKL